MDGVDFGAILAGVSAGASIEPSRLYEALPNKAPGYGYLRLVQGQVLEQWHAHRHDRDVVIKVNTGGGKTIDGLIILQSLLNEGQGPALYVAPGRFLVDQALREAANIGLPTVTDPDDVRYLRSEAICVINAYKLVNGKSVFADARSPRSPAPIGSVVIDDVHSAIATTRAQLSLSIPDGSPVFEALLGLFAPELKQYSPNAFMDVEERAYGALAPVPFWVWRSKLESVRRILRQHSESEELKFNLPAIRDALPYCRAVFSGSSVSISPSCPPISHISNFTNARHRIYLTATLADDSVLVTDFDADPESVAHPIAPATAGDIGERLILAPQEINPDIESDEIRIAMKTLSRRYNVVVLVPSDRVAKSWAGYADRIADGDNVADAVDDLRDPATGPKLVVLVNKYDGIDLPGDSCRVLVLDGLPESFSPEERRESELTSRTAGTDDRQIQRIEQGMGRAVRSNEDHCVVFLIGARLSQLLAHPDTAARLSPATSAQVRLSSTITGPLSGASLTKVLAVAQQALDRDESWVKLAKAAITGLEPRAGHVASEAIARRRAFDLAVKGDVKHASEVIQEAAKFARDARARGWLLEQAAAFTDHLDPAEAQEILASAREANGNVLRPIGGATYHPIKAPGAQSVAVVEECRLFASGTDLILAYDAILADLVFDQTRTEEFEAAFHKLGSMLGLRSERPERDLGKGPDNLWSIENDSYWVVEAKSGATSDFIKKTDVNQLSGSVNWFRGEYSRGESCTPVMIHPSTTLGRDATAVPGMRVITKKTLALLIASTKEFARALATKGWMDSEEVGRMLRGHKLDEASMSRYLVPPSVS